MHADNQLRVGGGGEEQDLQPQKIQIYQIHILFLPTIEIGYHSLQTKVSLGYPSPFPFSPHLQDFLNPGKLRQFISINFTQSSKYIEKKFDEYIVVFELGHSGQKHEDYAFPAIKICNLQPVCYERKFKKRVLSSKRQGSSVLKLQVDYVP